MTKFIIRAALGFICRILIVAPFALLLFNMGEYAEVNDNLSIFIAIVLGAATILYLAIMTFVPAEYAIKTSINIIEFHMWTPQIVAVILSATIILGLSIAVATSAMYYSAIVLLLYAISLYMWPKYIKRIDIASKDHMLKSLQTK